MPTNYRDWSMDDRTKMLDNNTNTELLAKREDISFEGIENDVPSILTGRVELPPINFDQKLYNIMIAQTLANETTGRWIRTIARVYYQGGKIYYSKTSDNDVFKIEIEF